MTKATVRTVLLVSLLLTTTVCLGQKQMSETTVNEEVQDKKSKEWKPELGLELNSELQATHRGDYNFVNLLRLNAEFPIAKGLTFELASLSTCMTADGSIGRERQTFSNLDAENIPLALSMCGLGWQKDGRHSLFVGVRNMNEDYFCTPLTSFFTNSSCGIYPTLSCNFDIANYPLASMGVHYKYNKVLGNGGRKPGKSAGTNAISVEASLYNGVGYHRFAGRENVFRVCPRSDGVFALAQVEYQHSGSRYLLGTGVRQQRGCGTGASPWIYTEQHVWGGLSLLAGYSHAFGDGLVCRDFAGVGIHYALPKVELGVFTDYARFSDFNEWCTELSCRFSLTSYLDLQPSVHLISTDNTFQSAALLRLTVSI